MTNPPNPMTNDRETVVVSDGSTVSAHATETARPETQAAIVRDPLHVRDRSRVLDAVTRMSEIRSTCSSILIFSDDATELHLNARSSCIIVTDDRNRPIGILTDRDIVRLGSEIGDFPEREIRDVMTAPIVTLAESQLTDLFVAVMLLRNHRIRHLPLVDESGALTGVLTHETLRQALHPVGLLRLCRVAEVMTPQPFVARPDDSIAQVSALMSRNRVSSIILVEPLPDRQDGAVKPVGVLTERDMVQFFALGLDPHEYNARLFVHVDFVSVTPQESLLAVRDAMERNRQPCLTVVGDRGELLGIITQSDLLALLDPVELYRTNDVLGQRVEQLQIENSTLIESREAELERQLQERTAVLQAQTDRDALIFEIDAQIYASRSVHEIMQTAAREVKGLLHCDCVAICRLPLESNASEFFEAICETGETLTISLHEAGLDRQWLQRYGTGELCAIADARAAVDCGCPPYLQDERGETRAKLVLPIVVANQLWGLLVASERSRPRNWHPDDIEFLEHLTVQLGIAVKQATAYEQLEIELVERQQAEIWWRESERRYASLAEAVPVGIFRTSFNGHIQYINQRCLDLLGLERSQINRDAWLDRIHPDDRDRVQAARAEASHNCSKFEQEYRIQYDDGTIRWISCRVTPSFDEAGEHQGYIGSIVDIHERKTAELSLQVVNQALEDRVAERTQELSALSTLQNAIVGGTHYSIVATDPTGTIVQVNAAAEKLLGYRAEELIEVQSLDIFHDPEELATRAAVLSAQCGTDIEPGFEVLVVEARDGNASEREWTYVSKTGERIPVLVSMTALLDPNGVLLGFVGIANNLSERQRAAAQLRRLSERLSLAMTAGQVGIWDWEIENDCLDWNDRMYELYGLDKESDHNKFKTWEESLHPDDRDRCCALIADAIAGRCEFETDFRIIHPDGTTRNIQAYSQTTRGTNGKAVRIIGLNLDITDRKLAEQSLRDLAQRELLIRQMGERIRQSLDIQEIFAVATRDMRQYLDVDRVGIFKFDEDGDTCRGEFVAEAKHDACRSSVFAVAIDDPCFDRKRRNIYESSFIQSIGDIDTADLDPCYREMLTQLEIRANLVVPLLLHDYYAWGLLCVHHCQSPRDWSADEIDFIEQIGNQLSIAVQQAKLFQRLQDQITTQLLKEGELKQQLAAIEASVDGIAVLENERFTYMNRAHVELFGFQSAADTIGRSWELLYADEEKARFAREVFPIVKATGQWQGETVALRRDGHQFDQELSLTLTENGSLICICRDITDRKRSEQELRRANEQLARATHHKDEFLANMSHELRTPLNAILGMTEGLQEGMLGDLTDEQNNALKIVERGGRHLLELINDILDLAKIEAGRVDLEPTAARIAPLCQASLSFVKQQAMKQSIDLQVRTPDREFDIFLDERRIRQVLINLLNNAVKFTPEGGSITLEVTILEGDAAEDAARSGVTPIPHDAARPDRWLRFSVTDTGIGIAPEHLVRLFKPFSQVDSALNRQYSGTGLGLSLVEHIAALHGGTVGVRSQVGGGSEFWMLIPLIVPDETDADTPPTSMQPQTAALPLDRAAPLILLAEDNIANILTMSNYLKVKGYRIVVAKNGREAIEVTQSKRIDLILMDIQMPEIDGLEAIGQIRQNPDYAETPIVAVTALTMGGDRERCLTAGADDYLAKPIQLKKLVNTIQHLLDRTKANCSS